MGDKHWGGEVLETKMWCLSPQSTHVLQQAHTPTQDQGMHAPAPAIRSNTCAFTRHRFTVQSSPPHVAKYCPFRVALMQDTCVNTRHRPRRTHVTAHRLGGVCTNIAKSQTTKSAEKMLR